MAGVQLDGGKGGFTGGGSGGSDSSVDGSGVSSGNESLAGVSEVVWVSSVSSGQSGKTSIGDVTSLPVKSFLGCVSVEEIGLGGGDSGSVSDGHGNDGSVDWSNGKVAGSYTESEVISDVVDSVVSSLIDEGVRSGDSSIGVSLLLSGRVDVLVAEGNVSEFVLGLELRAYGAGNGSGVGNGGRSGDNGSRSSNDHGVVSVSSDGNGSGDGSINNGGGSETGVVGRDGDSIGESSVIVGGGVWSSDG